MIEVHGIDDLTATLTNGPINAGLYTYDLYKVDADGFLSGNGAGQQHLDNSGLYGPSSIDSLYVLASHPNESAYNVAALPDVSFTSWYAGTQSWIDRSGDLRGDLGSPQDSTAPLGYVDPGPVTPATAAIDKVKTPDHVSAIDKVTGIWGNIAGTQANHTGVTTAMTLARR